MRRLTMLVSIGGGADCGRGAGSDDRPGPCSGAGEGLRSKAPPRSRLTSPRSRCPGRPEAVDGRSGRHGQATGDQGPGPVLEDLLLRSIARSSAASPTTSPGSSKRSSTRSSRPETFACTLPASRCPRRDDPLPAGRARGYRHGQPDDHPRAPEEGGLHAIPPAGHVKGDRGQRARGRADRDRGGPGREGSLRPQVLELLREHREAQRRSSARRARRK